MTNPCIIQGGMGIGISNWQLAQAVSRLGQLGVVSGTGINSLLIRRLQDGDHNGKMRQALAAFPDPELATQVIQKYYLPKGREPGQAYLRAPAPVIRPSLFFQQLMAIASFVEVFLAKEGHAGLIGINFLEKLQLSNLPGIYGAMLAGVDYVLMGAGIPREIPGVLDRFSTLQEASLRLSLEVDHYENKTEEPRVFFSPTQVFPNLTVQSLKRPQFLAIVSSSTLATHLMKKSTGTVQGFIVETPTAGGHNAPPRGPLQLNDKGEPIYSAKDGADFAVMRQLGVPFWLAGSFGSPQKFQMAQELGAAGVQIGTAFAFCEESGLSPELKMAVLTREFARDANDKSSFIFTDPKASPTGFPFKVVSLPETLSEQSVYTARPRRCDLGYLRHLVRDSQGKIEYRCPAEPEKDYIRKGGHETDTHCRKCLCNALMANLGLGQTIPQESSSDLINELPLLTAGDDLMDLKQWMSPWSVSYRAQHVIDYLFGRLAQKAS